jgi:CHAT domain-containing protein
MTSTRQHDLLLVAMPETPGTEVLPGVEAEVERLTRLVAETTVIRAGEATRTAVLTAMPTHRIAHFACHGISDPGDVTASRLLLHDHLTSPLTIAEVSTLYLDHAELAYLSACDTTRTRPALADEAVHITGAFQLAGYRQVIGTLWSVTDRAAIRVADDVYQYLTSTTERPRTEHAARALHQAILRLREDRPNSATEWSGYVHVGA